MNKRKKELIKNLSQDSLWNIASIGLPLILEKLDNIGYNVCIKSFNDLSGYEDKSEKEHWGESYNDFIEQLLEIKEIKKIVIKYHSEIIKFLKMKQAPENFDEQYYLFKNKLFDELLK